jgi:hypothetical protein
MVKMTVVVLLVSDGGKTAHRPRELGGATLRRHGRDALGRSTRVVAFWYGNGGFDLGNPTLPTASKTRSVFQHQNNVRTHVLQHPKSRVRDVPLNQPSFQ